VIFYGSVVLILILFVFIWKIDSLSDSLKQDCVNSYDVETTCPCMPIKSKITSQNTINFSSLSIYNQTS